MTGFPSDEAIPLDGTVGALGDEVEAVPFGGAEVELRVHIAGEAVTDPTAMGLADDLGLLVEAFMRRRPDLQEQARSAPPEPDDEIQVALHGLGLEPDAEQDLQRRVQQLVRNRLAQKEAGQ